MEKKTDRRVLRTKEAIKEAFFTLLEEKEIEKITVKELCDLANINRTSFYDHYLDYPGFLESLQKEFAHRMFLHYEEMFTREKNAGETMKEYLHLIRNSRESKLLFSEFRGQSTIRIFEEELKQRTFSEWNQIAEITPVQAEFLFRYINSGGFAVIQQWYEGGFVQTEEEIEAILTKVITKGLYAFLYPNQ